MMLVYLLFALTLSTILTALFGRRVPQRREGEMFIGFFIAFMALAWAADEWLLPALAAGRRESWTSETMLVVVGAACAASLALSVRMPRVLGQSVLGSDSGPDAEAAIFDMLLWVVFLIGGIIAMKSAGI